MPSLRDLKDRKKSVESTRKITSAMKMVAAAKLKRAQDQALAGRPYALHLKNLLGNLMADLGHSPEIPPLLAGTGKDQTILYVVITSDRGLCGSLNSSLTREVKSYIQKDLLDGKKVKIFCIGKKGRELLRRDYHNLIIDTWIDVNKPRPNVAKGEKILKQILAWFDSGEFDRCVLCFSQFRSAMVQEPALNTLIPLEYDRDPQESPSHGSLYIFEPSAHHVLESLLPQNLKVQVYNALLESFASEQGARMTAMDSATRNAGDMIRRLELTYNRARQAHITKELIEIISGAEAV